MVSRRTRRPRQGRSGGRWRSRTGRTWRREGWLGRRRLRGREGRLLQGHLFATRGTQGSALVELFALVALPRLPALRPAVITNTIAQSEHGIDKGDACASIAEASCASVSLALAEPRHTSGTAGVPLATTLSPSLDWHSLGQLLVRDALRAASYADESHLRFPQTWLWGALCAIP